MPQFTVLMANYNNAAFIEEAVQSVLDQTFSDWELVIVDDASKDDSVARIERYLSDTRIKLFRRERNQGYTEALIFGLTKVSSGIVGLLDSDDALTLNALEKAHNAHVDQPEVGLVLSQVIYCDAQLNSLDMSVTRPQHRGVPLVWMIGPNLFRSFKMEVYNRTAGLDPRFRHAEDWDLVFKLEEAAPTLRIDEPLYRYRILQTSASNAPRTYGVGIRSTAHALYRAYRRRGRVRSDIPRQVLLARLAAAVRHSIVLNEPMHAVAAACRAVLVAPFEGSSWRVLRQSIRAGLRLRAGMRSTTGRALVAAANAEAGEGMMLRSFAVSALQSNTGNIEPDCIRCIPLLHKKGHCIYGGDFLISEDGVYRAVFELDIKPYDFAQDPLVNLDIYENLFVRSVLAESVIEVADARNRGTFYLDFKARKGYRVEFRAFWREQSVLKAHGVVLWKLRGASAAEGVGEPALLRRRAPSLATVSAIIPCYNGAQWLGEAIASIKAQTRSVDEIIVVDDASTDESYEIAQHHDVIVLRNCQNSGEGASRNVGLRHAKGDLIAWLDADDLWAPHHVETLTGLLGEHPEAAAAFAAVQRFGARNELIRGYIPPGEPSNVFWFAFADWVHTTIGSMTRRSALLSISGFDEHERYSVDFDLWLRLSRWHLFVSTYEVTSCWRWHSGQQSVHQAEQIAALYRFRRRYWERETASGDPAFAAQIESRMSELWREEMRAAWDNGDVSQVRHLYGLVALLPKAPPDLADWTLRAGVSDEAWRQAR